MVPAPLSVRLAPVPARTARISDASRIVLVEVNDVPVRMPVKPSVLVTSPPLKTMVVEFELLNAPIASTPP